MIINILCGVFFFQVNWMYQSAHLMVSVKRTQLRSRKREVCKQNDTQSVNAKKEE